MRGNTHLCHLIHVFGTDLDFDRDTVWPNHGGVQGLISVGLWNRDVVFYATRARFVQAVHLAQYAVAGIQIVNDNAEGVDIHDRVKTLLFQHHFAVDRVQMFLATANATRNSRFLQTPFNFRKDLLNHLFTVTARGFHHLFNDAITVWIQRFKAQLFELGLDVVDT